MPSSPLRTCWHVVRGLALALISASALAGAAGAEPDPAVMESLGLYVASLQHRLDKSEVRGLSHPTEQQAGVLALELRDAQMLRLHLRTRGRDLPPDGRQARALQQFLEAWSEESFAEAFRAAPRHSALDPAVRQLARTFPEVRSMRTLLPLFRP